MANIGELATRVTANVKPFENAMRSARRSAQRFDSALNRGLKFGLRSLGRGLTGAISTIVTFTTRIVSATAAIVGLGGALSAGGLAAYAIKTSMGYEDAMMRFKVFLKDADAAQRVMDQLSQYTATTPFEEENVREAAAQIMAFGVSAEDMMDWMKKIGDLAAGTQKPLTDFTRILGKVNATQKVELEAVNQLAERGVDIWEGLSKLLGKPIKAVRDDISRSKVTADQLFTVVWNNVKPGGRYYNATEEMGTLMSSRLATLRDNVKMVFREVGDILIKTFNIKPAIDKAIKFIQSNKPEIVAWFQGVADSAKNAFNDALPKVKEFGEYFKVSVLPVMQDYYATFMEWAADVPARIKNIRSAFETVGRVVKVLNLTLTEAAGTYAILSREINLHAAAFLNPNSKQYKTLVEAASIADSFAGRMTDKAARIRGELAPEAVKATTQEQRTNSQIVREVRRVGNLMERQLSGMERLIVIEGN
jgi:hypothetical protein